VRPGEIEITVAVGDKRWHADKMCAGHDLLIARDSAILEIDHSQPVRGLYGNRQNVVLPRER
jgi:hypothetical protein